MVHQGVEQAQRRLRSMNNTLITNEQGDTNMTNMTMKQALDNGIFAVECCNGCGCVPRRLYLQTEGMYAGSRYCRSCATEALKQKNF